MEEKGRGSPGQNPRGRTGVGARHERVSAEPTCRGNYPCIQREVDAIGPHDGARTRAQNRLSRNSSDALTSLWISRERAYRKSWWWNPRCWRSHRRRRRRASRPRQHRQPAEREKWRRRARVSGRLPEESPGKRCHEIPIIPKGFNPRNALESASAPRRAARPDPTRAWIQIIWSVDNVNRAFVAPRRAGSGTNSR